MSEHFWSFTGPLGETNTLPLASVETTLAYTKSHGFHAALVGQSKHGKTHVASTLVSLADTVEILDTDGGMMTGNKQLQQNAQVTYTPCWGLTELRQKIEASKATFLIVDSISAALDQSYLLSVQADQAKQKDLGSRVKQTDIAETNMRKHALYANALFSSLAQAISYACRFQGKIVVSLCGVKDLWQGDGDARRYMGVRANMSDQNSKKYAHVTDIFAGQVREPSVVTDSQTGQAQWDYTKIRYMTILKPDPTWHFVGFRGDPEFANKLPQQIENFNLSYFLRAYVHHLQN